LLRLLTDRQRDALQRRRVQAVLRGCVGAGLERLCLQRLHLGAGLPVSAHVARSIYSDGANRERASANGDKKNSGMIASSAAVATPSERKRGALPRDARVLTRCHDKAAQPWGSSRIGCDA
jgi:hypothetical protein